MYRRLTTTCILLGSMIAVASGCSSTSSQVTVIDDHPAVALGVVSTSTGEMIQVAQFHQLGAGDALGQSMYRVYLAHYYAKQEDQRIAGVRTDNFRPE
jgi:hypothetical protein